MSDKDIPTSGSRWEPADGVPHDTAQQPVGTPAVPPAVPAEHAAATDAGTVPAEHEAAAAGPGRPSRIPRRLRRRSALAAAGVGLVLAGGIGGFAVGHAVAGTDGAEPGISTDADQDGIPGGPPDGDRHFRPDGDRDGQGAPGTPPDASTPDDHSSSSGDDEGGTA